MTNKSRVDKNKKKVGTKIPAIFTFRSNFLSLIEKGKTLDEIHSILSDMSTVKAPCLRTLCNWRKKYLEKTFSIEDKRKGSKKTPISKYKKIAQEFRRSGCNSVKQYAKQTGKPRSSVAYALHKAGMHYGKMIEVPKILNSSQRKERVDNSKVMLSILKDAERVDFQNIITLDETPFYFENKTKMGWYIDGKPIPRVEKPSLKQKKVTLTIAWGVRGAVVVKCIAGENRINAEYFCKSTLAGIERWVRKNNKYAGISSYYIHMDNAPCHKAAYTQDYMDSHQIIKMLHPPYSPDLAPCDFHLFGYMKNVFANTIFKSMEEIEEKISEWINQIPIETRISTFKNWMTRLEKCILLKGDYVDKDV